jgi:hypothetical protein
VVKIPRRIVSATNGLARDTKKSRQLAPNLPHQNDKNYCNINYLNAGWGARIRTWEWRNQNPLPYHLATPHRMNIWRNGGRTIPAHPAPINALARYALREFDGASLRAANAVIIRPSAMKSECSAAW